MKAPSIDDMDAVAFRFEQAHGQQQSNYELMRIREVGLEKTDPDDIANMIWESLSTQEQSAKYRSGAYWALGKARRKKDKQSFVKALNDELKKDIHVTYQIMVALENLGEPVFNPLRHFRSINDSELNKRDAEQYLSKQE